MLLTAIFGPVSLGMAFGSPAVLIAVKRYTKQVLLWLKCKHIAGKLHESLQKTQDSAAFGVSPVTLNKKGVRQLPKELHTWPPQLNIMFPTAHTFLILHRCGHTQVAVVHGMLPNSHVTICSARLHTSCMLFAAGQQRFCICCAVCCHECSQPAVWMDAGPVQDHIT